MPELVHEWTREALGASSGAHILFIENDPTGMGREMFRRLGFQLRSAVRPRDQGKRTHASPRTAEKIGHDPMAFRERQLHDVREELGRLGPVGDGPVVLFMDGPGRCDERTRLLADVLLDCNEDSSPFNGAPAPAVAIVVLDDGSPGSRALADHPAARRVRARAPFSMEADQAPRMTVETLRAFRFLDLASEPLTVAEVENLAGAGTVERLKRASIVLERSGRGPGALVALAGERPAGVPSQSSLPGRELAAYHARLLDTFERRPGGPAVSIARWRHAIGACDPAAVARTAGQGIEQRLAQDMRPLATAMLVESLEVLAGSGRDSETLRLRRVLAGLQADAGASLEAAASLMSIPASRRTEEDDVSLARNLIASGRVHEAHDCIRAALAARSGRRAPGRAEPLLTALAEAEYARGNLDEASSLCRDIVASADAPAQERARARNTIGKIHLARGAYAEAERIFAGNLREARREGLERHATIARINSGIARMRLSHLCSARKLFAEAAREAGKRGFYREEAIARENLATVHHMLRDYREAMRHYRAAFALLRWLGNPEYLSRIANNLGEIYVRFGEAGKARATRRWGQSTSEGNPHSQVEAEGMLLDGRIALLAGDCGTARAVFGESDRVFAGLGDGPHRAEALVWQASAALAVGDCGAARDLITEAEHHFQGDRRVEARILLERGRLERLSGGKPDTLLTGALDLLRASGDLEGETEALVSLAEAELDRGDTVFAARHIAQAIEVDSAIRARVPAEHHASFDAMPSRRRLDLLSRRAGSMGAPAKDARPAAALVPAGRAETPSPYPRLIGRSEAMQAMYRTICRVAPLDDLVLVTGESGSGKELVAEAIHKLGRRADRPLVKINCASFVETLLQSELFGHERGAFTGAIRRRRGWFEAASGGTLFLDEIGDVQPSTQVNLLRVLEEKAVHRVGGSEPIPVDVRIIAATNRDLAAEVGSGRFRKDLYYRLRGLRVQVPSLAERREDIRLLALSFLDRTAREFGLERRTPSLTEGALALLENMPLHGNVRELENTIRSAVLFAEGRSITQSEIARFLDGGDGNDQPAPRVERAAGRGHGEAGAGGLSLDLGQVLLGDVSLPQFKKEVERRCIAAALDESGGNITKAASILGMKRPRLSQLVKFHGVPRDAEDTEE